MYGMYSDDPALDAERYAAALERTLESLPVCDYCGQHIQDEHLWDIDGVVYHEDCAEKLFRKRVDDAYGC